MDEWNMEEYGEVREEEGHRDDARRAIAKGLSFDLISDITGLSLEIIQNLAETSAQETAGN
jgi:hypothetical protein